MKRRALFYLLLILNLPVAIAQTNTTTGTATPDQNTESKRRTPVTAPNGYVTERKSVSARQAEGYVVYKTDTLKGLIWVSKTEVLLERMLDSKYSYVNDFKLKNTDLKTIMLYNQDGKPLCLTRVKPTDKRMMRLVHEGKLNIYDDQIRYIYKPTDIDKAMIVISYNGEVEELGAFFSSHTKYDLIGYINDIYGLNLDHKSISWKDLLVKIDGLD